jgi:hypothetical protein
MVIQDHLGISQLIRKTNQENIATTIHMDLT